MTDLFNPYSEPSMNENVLTGFIIVKQNFNNIKYADYTFWTSAAKIQTLIVT